MRKTGSREPRESLEAYETEMGAQRGSGRAVSEDARGAGTPVRRDRGLGGLGLGGFDLGNELELWFEGELRWHLRERPHVTGIGGFERTLEAAVNPLPRDGS